jgi:molybdopterin synthase catalytic subunit
MTKTTTTLSQEDLFELVQAPIDVPALHRFVRGPADGAIVIFDGFVRNESHGRAT